MISTNLHISVCEVLIYIYLHIECRTFTMLFCSATLSAAGSILMCDIQWQSWQRVVKRPAVIKGLAVQWYSSSPDWVPRILSFIPSITERPPI